MATQVGAFCPCLVDASLTLICSRRTCIWKHVWPRPSIPWLDKLHLRRRILSSCLYRSTSYRVMQSHLRPSGMLLGMCFLSTFKFIYILSINYLIEHTWELRCRCLWRLWWWRCVSLFLFSLFCTDSLHSLPMGVYSGSTWYQGTQPTPTPHPAPSSSNCKPLPSVTASPLRRRQNGIVRRHANPTPFPTAI